MSRSIFVSLEPGEIGDPSAGTPGVRTEEPPLKVLLAGLIEDLDEGVIACDQSGEVILFNRAARHLFGLPEGTILPTEWAEHFDMFDGDGKTPLGPNEGPLAKAFQGNPLRNQEVVVVPKDGSGTRCLLMNGRSIGRYAGKLGAPIVMHEISERKQEEAMRVQEAERRSRQKQAIEVNDNVVQALVDARWALAAKDTDGVSRMLKRALEGSVQIIRDGLKELKDGKPLKPGDFMREEASGELPKVR